MAYKKPVFIFAKAQVSAFIGGVTDYLVMIACTELLHVHYTISIVISGLIGAVVNFSINRSWAFRAHQSNQSPITSQLSKFMLMLAGSIFLKAAGTYLLTQGLHLDYRISRIIIDIIVSLGFNFILQNFWVFKMQPATNARRS
ncbi:GtrA family protein [Mucilaginibacter arboris]|uniref:GtrA family protein n=1 Tax=Mucilaginibacter arboris TaxID=2682090 RepID=A0A7K1T0U5_9SPHI|nr:GtrA family protein [Mucilaginibacter arboris]MVN23157.1 GtrA family protein [Mucilaginibacter arboris]